MADSNNAALLDALLEATAKGELSATQVFDGFTAEAARIDARFTELDLHQNFILQQLKNEQAALGGSAASKAFVKTWNTKLLHPEGGKDKIETVKEWAMKTQNTMMDGYRVITGFRQVLTGQQIIYHILDGKNKIIEVNEEQFINLISSGSDPKLNINRGSLDKAVSDIEKGKKSLMDLMSLKVAATKDQAEGGKGRSYLEKWASKQEGASVQKINDVLFNYLVAKARSGDEDRLRVVLNKETGATGVAYYQIFEIYDQLRYSKSWIMHQGKVAKMVGAQTVEGFTEKRKQEIDKFVSDYLNSISSNASDPFYGAGDTTKDQYTLIENKVKGGVVHLATVRNAIKKIASFKSVTSIDELKKKLNQMFSVKATGLIRGIRKDAHNYAIKSINDFCNKLKL